MESNPLKPENWIDLYADYLFNYTITRVSDREVAEDLVQDTFLAALKSAKNYKGEASERTWLISILKRKIIDHYRKINSKKGKAEIKMAYVDGERSAEDWLEQQIKDSASSGPDESIENEELGMAIYACLSKLPKKQAEVFKLKTIDGYDTETICKELQITASNLWVLIYRARTSLVKCLEKNWF